MIRNLALSLVAALPLAFGACTSEQPTGQQSPTGQQQPAKPSVADRVVAEPTVYDVMCGCSIPGGRKCGNWIKIDGQYIPIEHADLGKMEWCEHRGKGAKVEATGEIKDGKYIAKAWKTVE